MICEFHIETPRGKESVPGNTWKEPGTWDSTISWKLPGSFDWGKKIMLPVYFGKGWPTSDKLPVFGQVKLPTSLSIPDFIREPRCATPAALPEWKAIPDYR